MERVSESNELARPTQLPVPIFPLVATFGNTQNYVVILGVEQRRRNDIELTDDKRPKIVPPKQFNHYPF